MSPAAYLQPHELNHDVTALEDDKLENEIKKLEKLFTVDREKLESITTHFVQELEEGKRFSPLHWTISY